MSCFFFVVVDFLLWRRRLFNIIYEVNESQILETAYLFIIIKLNLLCTPYQNLQFPTYFYKKFNKYIGESTYLTDNFIVFLTLFTLAFIFIFSRLSGSFLFCFSWILSNKLLKTHFYIFFSFFLADRPATFNLVLFSHLLLWKLDHRLISNVFVTIQLLRVLTAICRFYYSNYKIHGTC